MSEIHRSVQETRSQRTLSRLDLTPEVRRNPPSPPAAYSVAVPRDTADCCRRTAGPAERRSAVAGAAVAPRGGPAFTCVSRAATRFTVPACRRPARVAHGFDGVVRSLRAISRPIPDTAHVTQNGRDPAHVNAGRFLVLDFRIFGHRCTLLHATRNTFKQQ